MGEKKREPTQPRNKQTVHHCAPSATRAFYIKKKKKKWRWGTDPPPHPVQYKPIRQQPTELHQLVLFDLRTDDIYYIISPSTCQAFLFCFHFFNKVVEATGLEPAASWSQNQALYQTELRLVVDVAHGGEKSPATEKFQALCALSFTDVSVKHLSASSDSLIIILPNACFVNRFLSLCILAQLCPA